MTDKCFYPQYIDTTQLIKCCRAFKTTRKKQSQGYSPQNQTLLQTSPIVVAEWNGSLCTYDAPD